MEGVLTGRQQIVFMQHANGWSMKLVQPISTQCRQTEHAALYSGVDFLLVGASDKRCMPKAAPNTNFPSRGIHTVHTHTHKLDLQFILSGAHTQASPHTQRNSMKRNGLASWGEWTATARGRRNDRKESLSFIWERCAHTSFVEQRGRVRGKVPMSPSLIGAYPSALSLSHYGRSRMLC